MCVVLHNCVHVYLDVAACYRHVECIDHMEIAGSLILFVLVDIIITPMTAQHTIVHLDGDRPRRQVGLWCEPTRWQVRDPAHWAANCVLNVLLKRRAP